MQIKCQKQSQNVNKMSTHAIVDICKLIDNTQTHSISVQDAGYTSYMKIDLIKFFYV